MSEIDRFLQAYPEAEVLLPSVSPLTLKQWVGEIPFLYPPFDGIGSFPTADREFGLWQRTDDNLMAEVNVRAQKQAELKQQFAAAFMNRVGSLLNMDNQTQARRVSYLVDLRNEFFAYPEKIEDALIYKYAQKKIVGWGDIEKSLDKEPSFRNFYREAIEYSQQAVPAFDSTKHLQNYFTGFVRNVVIPSSSISIYAEPELDAEGAYFKDGKIIWSISKHNSLGHPAHWDDYMVRWGRGDFVLKEVYLRNRVESGYSLLPTPYSQSREAEFQIHDNWIKKVRVNQTVIDGVETFFIEVDMRDDYFQNLRIDGKNDKRLVSSIKENPSYFADVSNIRRLLRTNQNT